MPLKEETLQQQLEQAKAQLEEAEKSLKGGEPRRHPKWREANSRVRQIQYRLRQHGKVRTLDDDLKQRKSEGASA